MEPLALITCLDGVGEMATLNLGTQRCEQPLQPFFQQNWLLFPRLLFTRSTGSCAACSLWRHPRLVWLVVVVEHGAPTNYRTWLGNRHAPFSRTSEHALERDKNPNVHGRVSPSNHYHHENRSSLLTGS